MIQALAHKTVLVTPPGAIVDNAGIATTVIDRKGFNHCIILVALGATDIAMGALKVQESDDNGVADAYADIPNANFATGLLQDGSAAALPSATNDNKIFAFNINLNGRKRYLKLVATAGDGAAGTYLTSIALLSRAAEVPSDATGRGLQSELFA